MTDGTRLVIFKFGLLYLTKCVLEAKNPQRGNYRTCRGPECTMITCTQFANHKPSISQNLKWDRIGVSRMCEVHANVSTVSHLQLCRRCIRRLRTWLVRKCWQMFVCWVSFWGEFCHVGRVVGGRSVPFHWTWASAELLSLGLWLGAAALCSGVVLMKQSEWEINIRRRGFYCVTFNLCFKKAENIKTIDESCVCYCSCCF